MCTAHNKRDLNEGLPYGVQVKCDDVGIPDTLVCDLASAQTGKNTEVMRLIRQMHIKTRMAEKGRGITQNHRAETEIREVKTKWKARMQNSQVPTRLWDYGLVYIAEINDQASRR